MMLARPSARAPSVPGRTRSQTSGLVSQPDIARINYDQLHSALEASDRRRCVGDARKRRIVAPQDETAGFGNVSHRPAGASGRNAANAEDIARGKTTSPATHVEVRYLVGRAESVHQSTNEDRGIRNGRRGWGRLAESDRFRSMLFRNAAHGGGGLVERGVP